MPRTQQASRCVPAAKSWWAFDDKGNPTPREGFTERATSQLARMAGGACGHVVSGMVVGDVRPSGRRRAHTGYPHPLGPQ